MKKYGNKKACDYKHVVMDLKELDSHLSIKVCKSDYSSANMPLDNHSHYEMTEIVYMVKGKQIYNVGGKNYLVNSGDVFITHPFEVHSTGYYPEDKSLLYYILIDLNKHKNDIIGYGKEGELIVQSLMGIEKRVFKGNAHLKTIVSNMISLCSSDHPYKLTKIRNYLSQFLISIYECAVKATETDNSINMKTALEYIEANIMSNIEIDTLAKISNLSVSRFKTNFTRQVGIPPHEYILRQKVEVIKNMLVNTEQSITDIAHNMSFSSSQHLSAVFKKFTLRTPKEYRRERGRFCTKNICPL